MVIVYNVRIVVQCEYYYYYYYYCKCVNCLLAGMLECCYVVNSLFVCLCGDQTVMYYVYYYYYHVELNRWNTK